MDNLSRAKKLYALAMRGVGGEKEAAQALLDRLLEKYGFSIDVLDECVVNEYDLNFHGEYEKKLLVQIVFKVTGDNNFFNLTYVKSGRRCKNTGRVRCTESQLVEIKFLQEFYNELWKNEVDFLMKAFIQKHRIFGDAPIGEKGEDLDEEDLNKLRAMMDGLSNKTPLIGIEGGV